MHRIHLEENLKQKLSGKRIGYIPVSNDFSSAGDRRRFLLYAKEYDLQWEIANPANEYDILFITTMANVSEWIDYKDSHPDTILIFDINNAFKLIEEFKIKCVLKNDVLCVVF